VASDLPRRVFAHQQKTIEGFTKKYNITRLVYYEAFNGPSSAIFTGEADQRGNKKEEDRFDQPDESRVEGFVRGFMTSL
jgi:putative endonuclease